jgi:GAF domain-containing protein
MASTAFHQDFHTRYYFRLNSEIVGADTDFDPALGFLAFQAQADTAVVYRFDQDVSEFRAVAAHAATPAAIRDAGVTLTQSASRWIFSLTQPDQGSANKEERFERFLERLQYGVDQALVIPLRAKERLLGLLTLGRRSPDAFAPEAIEVARRTGRALTAVLEGLAQQPERLPASGTPAELARV